LKNTSQLVSFGLGDMKKVAACDAVSIKCPKTDISTIRDHGTNSRTGNYTFDQTPQLGPRI